MTPQEEIKEIMLKNGISYHWIAEKLGTYYQKIHYAIETAKDIPISLYTQIMLAFEKHGYAVSSDIKCENLIELTFLANSQIGKDLKVLNDSMSNDIKDRKYTPDERLKARVRIEDLQKETNDLFERMIKLTYADGK